MSYSIIRGVNQLNIKATEVENQIYLPLEAFWDDYTILKQKRVVFLDSPIAGLEVGLLVLNRQISDPINLLEEILTGAGCNVTILTEGKPISKKINLVLELDPAEGVFQVSYGGYILNGSRKLASDIGWAMSKMFELDFILPPYKCRSTYSKTSFWNKVTIPIISIKWRKGVENNDLLAAAILLGLFRFSTGKLPMIDEQIFRKQLNSKDEGKNQPLNVVSVNESKTKTLEQVSSMMPDHVRNLLINEGNTRSFISEDSNSDIKGDECVTKNHKNKSKQGRLVTDPSPKLQAYMKKIIAEQNLKAERDAKKKNKKGQEKIAPDEIYKKAGLGKG